MLAALEGDREETLRELERTRVDAALLAQAEAARELISGKAAYIDESAAILTLGQRIEAVGKSIATALSELGRDWTEERLRSLDRSLFAREEIERKRQALDELKSARINAENGVNDRKRALQEATREEGEATKELAKMPLAEREADEETLEALQKGRDQFASTVADLPVLQKERDREKQQVKEALREISSTWDKRDVVSFDCSLAAREKVETFERLFSEREGEIRKAEGRIEAAEAELRDVAEMVDRKTRQIEEAAAGSRTIEELASRRSALKSLRGLAAAREKLTLKIDYEKERLGDKEEEKKRFEAGLGEPSLKKGKIASFALVVVGAMILCFLLTRGSLVWLALGVIFLLAGVVGWLFAKRASKTSSPPKEGAARLAELNARIFAAASALEEAKSAIGALDGKIEELVRNPAMLGQPATEDLDLEEGRVEEEIRRAEKRTSLIEERKVWETRAERALKVREEWKQKKEAEAARLASAKEEWEAYLAGARLAPGMTTRTAFQVFGAAESLRGRLKDLAEREERIDGLERRQTAYLSLAVRAASLDAAGAADAANVLSQVDAFLKRHGQIEEDRRARATIEARLKERSERRTVAKRALDEAETTREKAAEQEKESVDAWRAWLVAAGFDGAYSPSTAMEALRKTDEAVRMLNERADLTARLRTCEQSVARRRKLAADVFEKLGRSTVADERLPSAIEALEQEYEAAKTAKTQKEGLQKKLEEIDFRAERESRELGVLREERAALLTEGEAASEEEFRDRAALWEKRLQLLNDVDRTESNIRKLSETEEIAPLREALGCLSKEELKIENEACAGRIAEMDEALHRAYDEKARLSEELRTLASADDLSTLRQEEEKIIEEIRLQSLEWGSHAIARHLLLEARKRFQEEQQPKVISDAAGFFSLITGGRYEKIVAPIGEDTIEIVSRDGRTKRPEHLSRGTAEQLYLALRFGYIANFTGSGETLPVVMDEILVNFDAARTRQAASAILALARTHQVIYFTCHPEIAALFQGLQNDIAMYEMKEGQVCRP